MCLLKEAVKHKSFCSFTSRFHTWSAALGNVPSQSMILQRRQILTFAYCVKTRIVILVCELGACVGHLVATDVSCSLSREGLLGVLSLNVVFSGGITRLTDIRQQLEMFRRICADYVALPAVEVS